ncbi:hypothetical protein CVH10_09845 [Halomonas sp. ND22Bw]|uniref:P-loop NTPase n=1 Tax=Halomonas sp. ND22Bw TaxID=2054178 RepID=UPI000D0B00DD|nr:hypothetical protein CVH10_09845 [Halomonas sp. ND22Bw]
MELDTNLKNQVSRGKAILFFGSGALFGAQFPEGKKVLLGDDLKNIICDNFLGGDFKESSLKFVAELAADSSNLFELQAFVADQFDEILPASFHKKIPLFNWRALFSTNYDRLIEDTYRLTESKLQDCTPIISNDDPLDESSRTNDRVPLFKLHGCVSTTRNEDLPLILTVDQYNEYLTNRDRLFNYLYELGFENTIIFVGHSLQDENIAKVISLIEKNARSGRPRYYLIKPGAKTPEVNLWAKKRITVIDSTFEDFINKLSEEVDQTQRELFSIRPPSQHPIQSKFTVRTELRDDLSSFLTNEVDYVDTSISKNGSVRKFYAGATQGWFPICHNLDCERTLTDSLFEDVIQSGEADRKGFVELHVIKGEAGSGKSVVLRRLAWRAANENGRLCLFTRHMAQPKFEPLQEISELSNERIFLFWDNAASNIAGLSRLLKLAKTSKTKITIITCERYTDWNTKCEDLSQHVTDFHKLRYLGRKETEDLVDLLEKHDCLGPGLTPLSREKRIQSFMNVFDRQLLVALHEATMGQPFEDIIYDEYNSLQPQQAKNLYRAICVLNRFRVPVRAGLIARVFGITFEQFSKDFFSPLEKVVIASGDNSHDIHYIARHPEIAEIVFTRAFESVQDRYHEYIKIIKALNVSFESDRQSFRSMVRAKSLMELFQDYNDIISIYTIAQEEVGRDAYLLQQMANFERLRENGNLNHAVELLQEAIASSSRDKSLLHTLAVVWKTISDKAEDPIDRDRYRHEAKSILHRLISLDGHTPYIDSVLIQIEMSTLQDLLSSSGTTTQAIDTSIRSVEKIISESKKRFSYEDHLLSLESNFAKMINDEKRAMTALEEAFEKDSRDPFIAIRLANIYTLRSQKDRAKEVLQRTLDSRRSDHKLNFAMGELLRSTGEETGKTLAFYYRRGFTPGDKNYQAQFWYARYAIESDESKVREIAKQIFDSLRTSRVSHEMRHKVRDYAGGALAPKKVRGRINRRSASYGFVKPDGFSVEAFVHEDSVPDDMWEVLSVGDEISFNIGFNYTGLVCKNVELL